MQSYFQFLLYDMLDLPLIEEDETPYMVMATVPFNVYLGNDIERAKAGIMLRHSYFASSHLCEIDDEDFFERDCSVLEMCIALALQMYDMMQGVPMTPSTPAEYFCEMVDNLGLFEFPDIPNVDEAMYDVVDRFVHRQYSMDGIGGIFPLRNPPADQRGVEIWYQMQAYLKENYPIF